MGRLFCRIDPPNKMADRFTEEELVKIRVIRGFNLFQIESWIKNDTQAKTKKEISGNTCRVLGIHYNNRINE